ncbi:MAG: sugar phosphate nucleotidyltransferase [Pseudomonadota bacterium]
MKAIILTSDKANRLHSLTEKTPLPMIKIAGKPIIRYLTDFLSKNGINHVIYNPGYLGNLLDNYMNQLSYPSMSIHSLSCALKENDNNCVENIFGSAQILLSANNHGLLLDDDFLVIPSDSILNFDIKEAMRKHHASGALCTLITTDCSPQQSNLSILLDSEKNNRIHLQKETAANSDLIHTQVYIFNPEVLKFIPENTFYDIDKDLIPKLSLLSQKIQYIKIPMQRHSLKTLQDYWYINHFFAKHSGVPSITAQAEFNKVVPLRSQQNCSVLL